MTTSRHSRPWKQRRSPPPARDGQPFQLAHPELVYALEHPELAKLRACFPEHPPEVVRSVENQLRRRGFNAASWAVTTYPLEMILEAINAFERDRKDGLDPPNPGGYLHALIKEACRKELSFRQRAGAPR